MSNEKNEKAEPPVALKKVDPRQRSLMELFERAKPAIAQVLPKHLTPERILKVALSATSRTPELLACTQQSLLQAVMLFAQLGLEPGGPLGHAYLVPYNNNKTGQKECVPIIGYRGMIELARRSQQIQSIEAHVVYARDKFRVAFGMVPVLEHEPTLDGDDPGKVIAAYMVARLVGGGTQVEVMTRAEIDAIRKRSRASANGPWMTGFSEMCRKTVVRRGWKYLPVRIEEAQALADLEEQAPDWEALSTPLIDGIVIEGHGADVPLGEKIKQALLAARSETDAAGTIKLAATLPKGEARERIGALIAERKAAGWAAPAPPAAEPAHDADTGETEPTREPSGGAEGT